jgi:cation diffusion facilitator CzcD-associated flavoprotein CzcO
VTSCSEQPDQKQNNGMKDKYEVIIIGSGFGGIAAAYNLQKKGITDYLMLERDEELGGTWWRNSYPGAQVDVQSHLYSLSFEPYDWSRLFAMQQEILKYTRHCLDKYGIREHAITHANVSGLTYDELNFEWIVSLADGRKFRADMILNASGGLSQPNIPEFPGREKFRGATMHTARWDHDYDYRDKCVAVIGSGASAIQVIPSIAPHVKDLYIFQRSPHWILPRPDRAFTNVERDTFKRFPFVRQAYRRTLFTRFEGRVIALKFANQLLKIYQKEAEQHIRDVIRDPELQRKVTPDFIMGCKRVLLSSDYYQSLNRDNVHLLTKESGIGSFNENGIATTDGKQVDVDMIVYATGFHASENNVVYPVTGRGGRTLEEEWTGGAHAYLGATVPHFPNLFLIAGPNTGTGHTSALGLIESQLEYVMRAIGHVRRKNARSIEVKDDVERQYNEDIQKQLASTVWMKGGCHSWYQTEDGKITTLYPNFTFIFRRDCKNFKSGNHILAG